MGNGEFQISDLVRRQWIQIYKSNKRIFYNKITEDQFQLIALSKVKTKCNITQIMQRSIYPLKNTPNIIILDDRSKQVSILVQIKTYELKAILNHISLLFQLLKIIRQIVHTLNALFHRFGAFKLTDKMLGFSKNQSVMVWINENFERNQIQTALLSYQYPQQQMLIDLINIIKASSSIRLDSTLFLNPPTTFLQFISKLDQILKQQRNILHNKKLNHYSKQLNIKPFSLNSQFKSFHNLHQQKQIEQYKIYKGQQIKDKNKVPNFVRNTRQTKNKIKNREGVVGNVRGRKDKIQINLGKIKSLNCSPQSKSNVFKLRDSYKVTNLFSPIESPQTKLGSLLFSKQSSKSIKNPEKVNSKNIFIPAIKNLNVKQQFLCTESSLQTSSDKMINKAGDMTFRNNSLSCQDSLGLLNSYCKSMSESRELRDGNQQNHINLMDKESSIIIYQNKDQSVFDGKYIQIYEEFSKILF